jgi:hypothetical protein
MKLKRQNPEKIDKQSANQDRRSEMLDPQTKQNNTIKRVEITHNLYQTLSEEKTTLNDLIWEQHRYHEERRWSAVNLLEKVSLKDLTETDQICIWNAGRAELTTKPGADRLARLSDKECRQWQSYDPTLAVIMQACGTWSRYWNEEEGFHECTLNRLSTLANLKATKNEEILEFRKIFPDDDMLRTLVLLAISEIVANVNYSLCAKLTEEPNLKYIFKQIAADEAQHMSYFNTFAKALIDSGQYSPKGALAVAHLFLKEGGELYGSAREQMEERDSHVNWWDTIRTNDKIDLNQTIEKKRNKILSTIRFITGIPVKSAKEVEVTWMRFVGC